MISLPASDLLFDDFALLQKQFGRERLMTTSVNTNCDCAGSPSLNTNCDCDGHPLTVNYENLYTPQIAQPAAQAH